MGSIERGLEGPLDCCTKSTVEELTRIIHLSESVLPGKLANSAVEESGDLE